MADVATASLLPERSMRHSDTLNEQLQTALNSRVVIEQAKGKLAERLGLATTTPALGWGLPSDRDRTHPGRQTCPRCRSRESSPTGFLRTAARARTATRAGECSDGHRRKAADSR